LNSGTVTGSNNLIESGVSAFGGSGTNTLTNTLTNVDPKLGPLQNNGGPTSTLALLPGSTAIDAGVPDTTLSAAIDAAANSNTLSVTAAAALAVTPGLTIQVDNEQMTITAVDVAHNTFTVVRGVNGTTEAKHAQGAPVFPATDQRGFTRVVGGKVDIGAFEVQSTDSTVALTTSSSPSDYGQAVTLTATASLTLSGTNATTGTVTFLDGSTVLASDVPVSANGQATFSTSSLTAGTHVLLARYNGAVGTLSTSGPLSQVVSPLAVTLSGSRPYDGTTTAAAGNLSITNLVGSDNVTLSGSASLAGANAGSQAISSAAGLTLAGSAATNYTLTGASGSVTIDAQAVTLSGSRLYDGTTTAAAGILSIANLVGSDTVTLSGSATLAGANAGSQAISSFAGLQLGGTAATNYTLTGASGSVTIAQAPLTVTANDVTIIQGEALPAFTAGYNGFAPGEGPGVLSGTLTFSTTAPNNTTPGTYDITPSNLSSNNYTITFLPGKLTILSYSLATTNLQTGPGGVDTAGLNHGMQNSLDAQLQAATADFADGDTADGASQLEAFINHVRAQRNKAIAANLADAWIAAAQRIISALG
jgi:hypothetical protein